MKIPKIISLAGLKESGKNATADILTELYGYEQIAFADPLKDKFASLIMNHEAMDDMPEELKDHINTGHVEFLFSTNKGDSLADCKRLVREKPYKEWQRRGLQLLGTEYYRAKDRCYWLKAMHLDPDKRYVITDRRFENETEWSRLHGAACVHIEVPGSNKNQDLHASEVGVPGLFRHYRILNPKDGLDGLRMRVHEALSYFHHAIRSGNASVLELDGIVMVEA